MQGGRNRSFTYDSLGRLLTAVNPESGTTNYAYDNNGNLTTKTDARNTVTNYLNYDSLNRVGRLSYSDSTPEVNYVQGDDPHG